MNCKATVLVHKLEGLIREIGDGTRVIPLKFKLKTSG